MKQAISILLLLISSYSSQAQSKTQAEYEKVFARYVTFYNNIQPDSLMGLFAETYFEWTERSLKEQHNNFGKIISFKYIGPFKDENDVYGNVMAYFKVTFDKPANIKDTTFGQSAFNGKINHAAAITLDKNNKIAGRRLLTTSAETDSLIAQY